jgi:copper chaperone CopZ
MLASEVNDMTCGHCARVITEAVDAVDGGVRRSPHHRSIARAP